MPLAQKQVDARAAQQGISNDEGKKGLLAEKQPSDEFATLEQPGELAVFLCSGAAWNTDGGWVAQQGRQPLTAICPKELLVNANVGQPILSLRRMRPASTISAVIFLAVAGLSAACSAAPDAAAQPALGATEAVRVIVPDGPGMNAPPFDRPRTLMVPPGFSISVFARAPDARFMAVAPNGDLLVSNPGAGTVSLLRPVAGKPPQRFSFAAGLNHPHDIVFHRLGDKLWVYMAESNRIVRAAYDDGQTALGDLQPVVDNLPDASSAGLRGSYGHQLKNIALHGDKLYVSIASTCNACASDTVSDPIRSAIYEYDADGRHRRLYAQGLRNAEGVRFKPGTDELWAAVNNRDNIAYPHHKDWDGDGKDDYGKVMSSYVDGHPPDLLVKVRRGGHYGWPFCNANPDAGRDNMPYDRDAELNTEGGKLDCDKIDRATKGLDPHSAPLGLSFLQESGLPTPFRNALVVALHGCWNCSKLNGHKLQLFHFRDDGSLDEGTDLVTGWLSDPVRRQRWGRPVAAVPNGKGGLYISDDYSGTIYLLSSDNRLERQRK